MTTAQTNSTIISKKIPILDSFIHYSSCGQGDPILFLHGIPTSSFLWRHIMAQLDGLGHCIAPDLIGMGLSGKPDIDYTLADHIQYIEEFIDSLSLTNITLVVHGWGSVIGFDIARRHEDKIKGLCFFESHIRPTLDWDMLSLPVQQFAALLDKPESSHKAIVEQNYLIEKLLPSGVVTQLSDEEMQFYRDPFVNEEDRKVLWQYIQDLPLGQDVESSAISCISAYSEWLQQTQIPKLMLYAMPGFITTIDTVAWAKDHFPQLEIECLEYVMHFAQESEPDLYAKYLMEWMQTVVLEKA